MSIPMIVIEIMDFFKHKQRRVSEDEVQLEESLFNILAMFAEERAAMEARRAKLRAEKKARWATMLSEWERTCSLPQSEEVSSVSVSYSCSLVCLT